MTLIGLALLVTGGVATWRFARGDGAYRAGPWPGVTPRGAGVLLGCALLLAGGQLILGRPTRPVPEVISLAAFAFMPVALAARLTRIPGAASAVCGAYLLPRTLLSLVEPGLEPPPLLLVPALVFDLSMWLRASRTVPQPGALRAAIGGGLFGFVLAVIEPSFAVLLGSDAATWSGTDVSAAAATSTAVCALLGFSAERIQRPR